MRETRRSRLPEQRDEEKQCGDLLTCRQGEVKGSRASRQLQWESGRESLAGDQETLALFERAGTTQGSVLGSGWVQEVGPSPTA